ncbi:MAG: thiol oxidoreductase, partial [Alphaproteobacteria bacterium]|nr:thiol oxidoreductase [Alphaproteobacteria bacterium]
ADPEDRDGDGISGCANRVWDATAGAVQLGRFGWKANVASLRDQNAGAFLGDMGITTDVFAAENCPPAQRDCLRIASRATGVEADAQRLDDLTFYMESVAVPARRRVDDPAVQRGETLFLQIGCAGCHTPRVATGDHANPIVTRQTIQPFTDLLLHDMGDGLADSRPDFLASGTEWRTPPLWGLGLIETVNGHEFLLHDGRARGMAEAILWHGGEAENVRELFRSLPADSRDDLLTFLRSL